ncbi:MAG: RDD family protein [Gammaproteobacteria bacterium]
MSATASPSYPSRDPRHTLLDTLRAVETPEGIELNLAVAGPVPRALAWVIDGVIRMILYALLSVTLVFLGLMGIGLLLIAMFLIEWFYPVWFELRRDGVTPGKAALGLRVLHDNGTPVGLSASMVRNLLRGVDFLPLFYGFGFVAMVLNRDFKRLGDFVAGTVVVHRGRLAAVHELSEAEPCPPPVPLLLEEQQALVNFAERTEQLATERSEELAQLGRTLAGHNERPLPRLLGMANWIAGQR